MRSNVFADLPIGNTGFVTDGNYQYQWLTSYVVDDPTKQTWDCSTPGSGNGLTVSYYNSIDFSGAALTRIDATIDFDWSSASPDVSIGLSNFSARWMGYVEPQY